MEGAGWGGGDWGNVRVMAPVVASVVACVVSVASILFCWKRGKNGASFRLWVSLLYMNALIAQVEGARGGAKKVRLFRTRP